MLKRLIAPSGLKIALTLTLGVLMLFFADFMSPSGSFMSLIDKKWVDFIIKERDVQPHSPEVAVAVIDSKSVDKYGRWPWPRSRMAQLVNVLNDHYQVTTIGFDIVFSEPEHSNGVMLTEEYQKTFASLGFNDRAKSKTFLKELKTRQYQLDGDGRLAEALTRGKNTILGYFFFNSSEGLEHLTEEDKEASASRIAGSEISLLKGTFPEGLVPKGAAVESNIERLYQGSFLSGYFGVNPDPEDGTVRRVHLLYQYGENLFPSLDLQILRHYYGADNIMVTAEQELGILEIQIGRKTIEPNIDGSILLNYRGPAGTFPHLSIYDIIEKKIPKETLQDRIVLIGATEVGVFDLRTTPVGVAYPGVEVHANLLDNILTDSYFRLNWGNDMVTLMLIVFFGLLLGFTLPHLKSIYGTLLVVGIIVVYTIAHRWMVMEMLTWTSWIYIVLTVMSVWAGVTLFRFLVTDKDKRFIKGAFQQYLSPDVISQLMDNPDMLKLGGERRELTAFFSDVQGFSTFSEQLEPEDLVHLLNVYLTEMTDIMSQYEGTVDKFEGDAIIAFFGAPVTYTDHAERACLVSLDMQARLVELRQMWLDEGKPELKMRIGLNTGTMVVGNMGSEKRFDYTMMGNAVNLAARLEGANKNYGAYNCISEYTYAQAKNVIEAREMDLIRVMGITTPVRIYELLCRKGELTDNQKKGYAYFRKGLELYRGQEWDEAVKYFGATMKFIPDDPPSKAFIVRCNDFKAAPPGDEWDGVYTATSK